MGTICRINVSETGMLFCPVKIKCGESVLAVESSLLDSGAGICHMTYRMWLDMGLHKKCWHENSALCKMMGINSPDDMAFDALPLVSSVSVLGDGSEVKVFEFRLDSMELGRVSLGFNHTIPLENITVRLINRKDSDFIVGWNVLKYLKPTYDPSPEELIYQFELTENGRRLMRQDRDRKVANCMASVFNYQQG